MRNNILLLLLSLVIVTCFASCDVDFDANDDWHETMLVYGVLDQDNDTNFVRIEKCFLGKGNYLTFAKQKDSLYYKEDELDLTMYAYFVWDTGGWDTSKAQHTHHLQYTTRYKESGDFYAEGSCPIYFTTDRLYDDLLYRLVIKNKKTGHITTAYTPLIATYSITYPTPTTSTSNNVLTFDKPNATSKDYHITLKWVNANASNKGVIASCFQPVIKFNCLVNSAANITDIPFNYFITKSNLTSGKELSYPIYRESILMKIRTLRQNNPTATISYNYDNPFNLYIYSCTKELKTYIDNNTPNESLTERALYTNINNGVGIFAARRLHISEKFSSCDIITQTAIQKILEAK